jgi:RNase adaptor protein for sRNA GlmZ degradation
VGGSVGVAVTVVVAVGGKGVSVAVGSTGGDGRSVRFSNTNPPTNASRSAIAPAISIKP